MSDQIQNKLLEYAPKPPENVWDAINNALDEGFCVSRKLYQFEETPPARVWNKINNELLVSQSGKVVPFFIKHRKIVRYSTAAAILLTIVITSTFVIGKRTRPTGPHTSSNSSSQPATVVNLETSKTGINSKNNHTLAAAQENETSTIENLREEKKTLLNKLRPQMKLGFVVLSKKFIPKVAHIKQTVSPDEPVEKYMVYSDGDGNAMKLPKKLFDFIACVKQDIQCQQQMMQLQQKFAATGVMTDFTGVLEMLKNLKENQ